MRLWWTGAYTTRAAFVSAVDASTNSTSAYLGSILMNRGDRIAFDDVDIYTPTGNLLVKDLTFDITPTKERRLSDCRRSSWRTLPARATPCRRSSGVDGEEGNDGVERVAPDAFATLAAGGLAPNAITCATGDAATSPTC